MTSKHISTEWKGKCKIICIIIGRQSDTVMWKMEGIWKFSGGALCYLRMTVISFKVSKESRCCWRCRGNTCVTVFQTLARKKNWHRSSFSWDQTELKFKYNNQAEKTWAIKCNELTSTLCVWWCNSSANTTTSIHMIKLLSASDTSLDHQTYSFTWKCPS